MKMMLIAGFALLGVAALSARGSDWPQYRGPNRDGVSQETGLRKEWPAGGPPLLWTYSSLGVGYSGPAIVGNHLYICCGRKDSEYLVAFDMKADGSAAPTEAWSTLIGPLFTWKGNDWNIGPNATPTVDGDHVYALGGNGDFICTQASDGKVIWKKNLPRELGGEVNPIGGGAEDPTPLGWGYASAPLVDGLQLICVPGGKKGLMAALDKTTGKLLWQSAQVTDQATYSSPICVDVGGTRQYIQVVNSGIVGVSAKNGERLWAYHRQPAYGDVVIGTPIFHDGQIFSSVGFGQGCDLIRLIPGSGPLQAQKILSDKSIQNRDGGVVLVGDHLYGYAENRGWFCAEFKTGKILWADHESLGRGSIASADGKLYCCAEKGGVVALVDASPAGWVEKGRLTLPRESGARRSSGGLWTQPVIANARLYIRDEEYLYCFDLKP